MRLIDADNLADVVQLSDPLNCGYVSVTVEYLVSKIREVPTVDPVKHGCWVNWDAFKSKRHPERAYTWRCSNCGCMFTFRHRRSRLAMDKQGKYCPQCGAKMDGEWR